MAGPEDSAISGKLEEIFRSESGRILATLVRLLGDLDLAEEAMQEAFAAALEAWPRTGVPEKPRPWLISTARFKAVDRVRRRARLQGIEKDLVLEREGRAAAGAAEDAEIEDDRLRLIFTCCHPALAREGQVALTLREICGLGTEEIARAFLVTSSTLAQRIVRAKAVIRSQRIPYQVPGPAELAERLEAVLLVVYLIFNEGYTEQAGGAALSGEAIRLGRLLAELLPEPEVQGLLALMLLQESRRAARSTAAGDVIVLEEQDRSRWNQKQIQEGAALTAKALASRRYGAYTLQAAIAAVHAGSASMEGTDWRHVARLYDQLAAMQSSPVVELNRAVAIAMAEGLERGLELVDRLIESGTLERYHLAHATRADLCRRLGRVGEARASYERALELAAQESDRRFLRRRLEALSAARAEP